MQRQTQRFEANFSRIVARMPEDLSSKIKTFFSTKGREISQEASRIYENPLYIIQIYKK
jgi:hypothetical protein